MVTRKNSTKQILEETLESIKHELADKEQQIHNALMSLTKSKTKEAVSRAVKKNEKEGPSSTSSSFLQKDTLKALDRVRKEMDEIAKIRKRIRSIENKMSKIYEK